MGALLLKLAAGTLAGGCAYLALALYENEDDQLCDRLAELWARIDDAAKSVLTREAAFVREVAAAVAHFLDRLFGSQLLTPMAISVSICWSIASLYLMLAVGGA